MMRRILTDTSGNMAIEFALVLPIFVLMVMGVAEVGFMMRERSTLDAAARAGLQVILLDPTDIDQAETMAQQIAPDAVVEAEVVCECPDGTPSACNTTCGGQLPLRFVSLTAITEWPLVFPWPGVPDPTILESFAEGRTQ
jgi:hypothetical protein